MLIGSMRFKRMRTRWLRHELLMLIILLFLNYRILPIGQADATKNEEAFQHNVIERPICDHELETKYCNAWYGGDLHTGKLPCQHCCFIFQLSRVLMVKSSFTFIKNMHLFYVL